MLSPPIHDAFLVASLALMTDVLTAGVKLAHGQLTAAMGAVLFIFIYTGHGGYQWSISVSYFQTPSTLHIGR